MKLYCTTNCIYNVSQTCTCRAIQQVGGMNIFSGGICAFYIDVPPQSVQGELAEACRCNRQPISIRCNNCGGLVPVKQPVA